MDSQALEVLATDILYRSLEPVWSLFSNYRSLLQNGGDGTFQACAGPSSINHPAIINRSHLVMAAKPSELMAALWSSRTLPNIDHNPALDLHRFQGHSRL